MVVLVQEMIYTCNLEEVDESRKKEVLVMAEDRNEEDADPGEKEIYNDFKLKIDRYCMVMIWYGDGDGMVW